MNEIQVFNNTQFGNVRVIMENGKPLFCAADVAKALGYSDTPKAIKAHCREDGWVIRPVIDSMGRTQQAKFINEGNLYRLVAHSELPSAEQFESWVFDEVLPSIRKTGSYTVPQAKPSDVSKAQLSEAKLLNARSRASSMWFKFSNMLDNTEHKQLCAAYGTQVLTGGQMVLPLPQVEHTYSAQEVADMYGITANRVGRIANENGLKTEKYGYWVMDVSKHCQGKTVQSFRYNETGARAIGEFARKQ
mgnify:FL=1